LINFSSNKVRARQKRQKIIKWSIGGVLFIVFVSLIFLFAAIFPANREEQFAFNFASSDMKLLDPRNFKLSNRNKTSYYSVIADKNGVEKLGIFTKDGSVKKTISTSKLVKNSVIEKIVKDNKYSKIIEISPAIYKKVPVYEITIIDKNNNLGYLTIDIQSGKVYRLITGI
jgi:uncharacterized protein YpmB